MGGSQGIRISGRLALTATILAACTAAPSHAETAEQKILREWSKLTPDNVASKVAVRGDELDQEVTFTTYDVFHEKRGLLQLVPNDSFVRAFLDRKTGQVTWQIYESVTYAGSWRFYDRVNFETSQGLQTVPLTVIDRDVISCAGECTYSEEVAFEVSDELIRAIGRLYNPGGPLTSFRFKLKGRTSEDFVDAVPTAEVAGIVKAVDDWKRSHF